MRALRCSVAFASLFALAGVPRVAGATGDDLEGRLRRLLDRPDALPGLRLARLELGETRALIGLELPPGTPLDALPVEVENRLELAAGTLAALRPAVARIDLLVGRAGEPLVPPPRSRRGRAAPRPVAHVTPDPVRFPYGQALRGKTVALSPGHGWIYYDSLMDYGTQRGRTAWDGCGDCRGIVEDFETIEIVVRQLVPLLEGAGARVVMVRERAREADVDLVDDADPTRYAELSGAFSTGSTAGGWGTAYRAALDPGASARFTLAAPAAGAQLLSLWFVAGANRLGDARLDVRGPFGLHSFLVDLRTHGRRWVPVALYDLAPGDVVEATLSAPNGGAGGALIADAMRLGAGKHPRGYPWWQMGAQPYAAYAGAPSDVQARGDVTARPRWAEAYGADAYVSLHSNASGVADSTAAGLASYRYNCGSFPDHSSDPPASDCDDPPGSDRLQALVHAAMVAELRGGWDPAWVDRGTKVANFGELRELDGIPGVLVESAFHDQARLAGGSALRMTDNQALHDPRWRRIAAYGIYRGLSEFLVGPGPLLPPAPAAVVAQARGSDRVEVRWSPVPGARGYRVYVARATRAGAPQRSFDQGTLVEATALTVEGLAPEVPVLVEVAALTEAGEGLASSVVTARPSARRAQVLLLDGFEREDAWIQDQDNRHDTLAAHARALADKPHAFDGASEAAVAAGLVGFDGYDAVIISLGAESTEHEVLSEPIRAALTAFAARGGAVLMSGSEVAWALDQRGSAATRAFLAEVFGASYGRDDAGARAVRAATGAWLSPIGAGLALDDGTAGGLRARSLDVLLPAMDAAAELLYGESGDDAAGIRRGKNLLLGVPLETLVDPAARAALLSAWLDRAVTLTPPPAGRDAGAGEDASARDAAASGDASAPDAGRPDASEPDAEVAADAGPAGLRRLSGEAPAISGGCTIGVGRAAPGGAPEGAAVGLLLLALLGARRPLNRRAPGRGRARWRG